ncbi:MAG: hypothetical protein O2819_00330 [Planctomycetota bacterium]|nr:hypothetical protein [Planctomycetota bacterium]
MPSRGPIERAARSARSRLRAALILERSLQVCSWFVGAGLALIVLDWAVGLPRLFRTVDFMLGVAALLGCVHYTIVPATQFRPRLADVARRIERAMPMLRGRLASALEFEIHGTNSPLAATVKDQVMATLSSVRRSPIVDRRVLRTHARRAAVVMALAALPWVIDPSWASVATQRLLRPWGLARWPASTQVDSLVEVTHAPRGMPLMMKASLTKGDPASTVVSVEWSLTADDGSVISRESMMPRQPDGTHEFLLEPGLSERVSFRFRTHDAESLEQVVRFIEPPQVRHVSLRVDPPPYATGVRQPSTHETPVDVGVDGAVFRGDPALEGSQVTVTLQLDPAPPCPTAGVGTEAMEEWTSRQWHMSGGSAFTARCEGSQWVLSWQAQSSDFVDITPTDQRGLAAPAPIRVAVDAVPDERPSIVLEQPTQDERVTGQATVEVSAQLADDVGLVWGALEVERLRVGQGQTQLLSTRREVNGVHAGLIEVISLAEVGGGCVAGDQLELRVLAQDLAGEAFGRTPVVSTMRRLRVVSRAQFEQDVAAAAQALRGQVVRADDRQAEVDRANPTDRRAVAQQVEVAERVASALEAAEHLVDRLERNNLGQESLAQAAREAAGQLACAGEAAGVARESMQAAGEATSNPEEQDHRAQAREAQRQVRDSLASAAGLLERDDDLWSLRRDMERVEERLDVAGHARESMSPQSAGKRPEELDAQDRQAMQQSATETEQAATQARDLLDELRSRAESTKSSHPERAQAMRDAAQRAERAGLTESLEQAAQSSRQNQKQQAEQAAAAARAALREMEKALEEEESLQLESLRRTLASLVERLESLVARSEAAEGAAAGDGDADMVADEVISLFHATGSAQDEAGRLGPDGVGMLASISRAGEQQSAAASGLRSSPADRAGAGESLARSTRSLRDALDVARERERHAEAQQQQQRLEELRGKYLAILPLEEDVLLGSIRAREDTLAGRRLLMEARRLALLQSQVLEQLDVVSQEPEVTASAAFQEAHRIARQAAMSAGAGLTAGRVDELVSLDAEVVRDVIQSMAQALGTEAQARDRFGRDQLSGGGGGGGGGGEQPGDALPPAAELKVLKSLQAQLSKRTRQIAEGSPVRPGEAANLSARQQSVAQLVRDLADALEEFGREEAPGGTGERAPGPEIRENQPGFGLHSPRDVRNLDEAHTHAMATKVTERSS